MNHEGCMWAIRNWVLNRSTVFFLPSTTCSRRQIANWIYEQALLALLHNYRNAMPLVFKKKREPGISFIYIQLGWLSERLCHVFQATAVLFTLQLYTYFECCRWLILIGRNKQMRCHVLHNVSLFVSFLIGLSLRIKTLHGCFDDALVCWNTWLDSCVPSNRSCHERPWV